MLIGIGRRQFVTALGSSLPAVSSMIAALSNASGFAEATGAALSGVGRTAKFRDGTIVPALGQGSRHFGQERHPEAVEEEALRTGCESAWGPDADRRDNALISLRLEGSRFCA